MTHRHCAQALPGVLMRFWGIAYWVGHMQHSTLGSTSTAVTSHRYAYCMGSASTAQSCKFSACSCGASLPPFLFTVVQHYMMLGRITTDGRLSGRLKYDFTDWLSTKFHMQLANEPGQSQGMFDADLKGGDWNAQVCGHSVKQHCIFFSFGGGVLFYSKTDF